MLAGTVDAFKGLLMKQAYKAVTVCNLLHNIHSELIVVHGYIGSCKYRSHLMLARSYLIMLGFGIYSYLPELFIKLLHKCLDSWSDGAVIMIIEHLSLRGRRTEKRTLCENQIPALRIILLIYKEIFLFKSYRRIYVSYVLSQGMQHSDCLTAKSIKAAQKRCLLVKHCSVI